MTTELIFGAIVIALLGGFGWYVREQEKTKSKLINALLAKTPQEFRDLNLTDKVEPIKAQAPQEPDLTPVEDLSDDEFEKFIQKEVS